MVYQTTREKIQEWIEKGLIPKLVDKDYIYDDVISAVAIETGASEKLVEDVILTLIKAGKIKHLNLLVATDEQLIAYNKSKEQAESDVKDAISGVINGSKNEKN